MPLFYRNPPRLRSLRKYRPPRLVFVCRKALASLEVCPQPLRRLPVLPETRPHNTFHAQSNHEVPPRNVRSPQKRQDARQSPREFTSDVIFGTPPAYFVTTDRI